jgi:hypothetical protein
VDPSADRLQDAAEHLPAAFQTAVLDGGCLEMLNLDCCRHWCAATGRSAEAVTVWAACAALGRIAAQLYVSVRTVSSHLDRIPD